MTKFYANARSCHKRLLLAVLLTISPVGVSAQETRAITARPLTADISLEGRAWEDASGEYRCRLPNGDAGYVRFGGDSTILLILAVILIGAGIFVEAPPPDDANVDGANVTGGDRVVRNLAGRDRVVRNVTGEDRAVRTVRGSCVAQPPSGTIVR